MKLKIGALHIRVYTDATFGCNWDLTSQQGYFVLLCDQQSLFHGIDFKSCKSRIFVSSILAGELHDFWTASILYIWLSMIWNPYTG